MNNLWQRRSHQYKDCFLSLFCVFFIHNNHTKAVRSRPAGLSGCGDALNGDDWPLTWRVNAESTTMIYAQCGASYCGDPLRSWGNKQLECRINSLCPSHTIIKFGYTYFGFTEEGVYDISNAMTSIFDTALNNQI